MHKKEIQKRRIMSYFIEATNKIIDEEGIDAVTIRKVANLAGYNSATLYNYFENLEHLIFFASMKLLKDYALDLQNYTKGCNNALEKYLKVWECFCTHSFKNPKIYYIMFFDKYSSSINSAIKQYYTIFPEELGVDESADLLPMLLERNIYYRDMTILKACANEGLVNEADLPDINEMILLMYQSFLLQISNDNLNYSIEEAKLKVLKYIRQTIKAFKVK